MLFQEILKTPGVEHAHAQIFRFGRSSAQSGMAPKRFSICPAKDGQFTFLQASVELAFQDLMVQNVV
jgi:hypothetical protein